MKRGFAALVIVSALATLGVVIVRGAPVWFCVLEAFAAGAVFGFCWVVERDHHRVERERRRIARALSAPLHEVRSEFVPPAR